MRVASRVDSLSMHGQVGCGFSGVHFAVRVSWALHGSRAGSSKPRRQVLSRGMVPDSQQIRSGHTESSIRFDAEDHDACKTLV